VRRAALRASIDLPYVAIITAETGRCRASPGEDIIDFSMGNLDGPTPPHVESWQVNSAKTHTYGYHLARHSACAVLYRAGTKTRRRRD
jgi:aspartate/methionine/tyrosine aminotransferase